MTKIFQCKNILLIALLIFCTIAFLKVLEEVWTKESILVLDQQIATLVYTLRTPLFNFVMLCITSLANSYFIAFLCAVLGTYFYVTKKNNYLVPLVTTVSTSFVFVEAVKLLTARARPALEHALVHEKSFSFPSGHTLIAITFYGLLVLYSYRILKTKRMKVLSTIIGIVLILSVGFSRVYLGAHWPSDVLASLLIGTSWLCFVALCLENKVIVRHLDEKLPILFPSQKK